MPACAPCPIGTYSPPGFSLSAAITLISFAQSAWHTRGITSFLSTSRLIDCSRLNCLLCEAGTYASEKGSTCCRSCTTENPMNNSNDYCPPGIDYPLPSTSPREAYSMRNPYNDVFTSGGRADPSLCCVSPPCYCGFRAI